MENFRRSMGLRIKETKEVWEGEVTEVTPEEIDDPHGGYGKTIASVTIGLKTTKGSRQIKLDPTVYENLQKEKKLVPAETVAKILERRKIGEKNASDGVFRTLAQNFGKPRFCLFSCSCWLLFQSLGPLTLK